MFLATFALLTAVARPLVDGLAQARFLETTFQGSVAYGETIRHARPVDETWYLGYDRGALDHAVIYHELGPAADYLRAADVVIMGNSRTQFAFHDAELAAFFERHGLTFFNMAFGYGERYSFPLRLMRHLDLRPRLVLVNAGNFFREGMSELAHKVVDESRFEGFKYASEGMLSFAVRRVLHQVYPRFAVSGASTWIMFNSEQRGSWKAFVTVPERREITVVRGQAEPLANWVQNGATLKAEIESRGGRMVLVDVPSGKLPRGYSVQKLADALGVPFIPAAIPHPMTDDGSHLIEDSAREFTRQFLAAFERSDSFRSLR